MIHEDTLLGYSSLCYTTNVEKSNRLKTVIAYTCQSKVYLYIYTYIRAYFVCKGVCVTISVHSFVHREKPVA